MAKDKVFEDPNLFTLIVNQTLDYGAVLKRVNKSWFKIFDDVAEKKLSANVVIKYGGLKLLEWARENGCPCVIDK